VPPEAWFVDQILTNGRNEVSNRPENGQGNGKNKPLNDQNGFSAIALSFSE
jgi:hypothetical protein